MAVFQNSTVPTYIVLGNEKPEAEKRYIGIKLYPFHGKTEHHNLCTTSKFREYKSGELFFASFNNANVIIKIGDLPNLAFSNYVPAIGITIPIKHVMASNTSGQLKVTKHILIEKLIKLSINTYVINPNQTDEIILVTTET